MPQIELFFLYRIQFCILATIEPAMTPTTDSDALTGWRTRVLTGVLAATVFFSLHAQTDSLVNLLSNTRKDTVRVQLLNDLAFSLWSINPLAGVAYAEEALHLSDSLRYQRGRILSYKTMGVCYWSLGSYEPALRACFDGLSLANETGDQESVNRLEHNIALIYGEIKNWDQAIYYLRKNIAWYQRTKQWGELPRVYNNLGSTFFERRMLDSSLANYQKALRATPYGENIDEAKYIFVNMSESFFHLKNFEKAFYYANKALTLYTAQNDKSGMMECHTALGDLHFARKQWREAAENYNRAFALAREGSFTHYFSRLLRSQARLDSANGNFRQAFTRLQRAYIIRDSLNNFKQKADYDRLLVQHRTEQKEKENELLRQANIINQIKVEDSQRLIWIEAIASILIISLLIVFYYKRMGYRKKLEAAAFQHKIKEEKERIAQDLHDNIGTQLTSLSLGLKKLNREMKIPGDTLTNLNNGVTSTMAELRDTIWAMNKEEVTVEQLGDKINNLFWRIQKTTEDIHFQLSLCSQCPGIRLKPMQAINLFRIVQEAVNNSLKHGEATRIDVSLHKDELGQLVTRITDNGRGFTLATHGPDGHYGLQNMQRRAKEISATLEIQSGGGQGTLVYLKFAL